MGMQKNIERLDDTKVIGLSTFQGNTGRVRIPARPLGELVGSKTQRQLLLETIASSDFQATGRTPTANAYAEAAAYLLGTTTGKTEGGILGRLPTGYPSRFYKCLLPTTTGGCDRYSSTYTSIPDFDYYITSGGYYYLYKEKIADSAYSGFSSSDPLTNNGSNYLQPNSLRQTEEMRQCSGQGIYVLTDGEPNQSSVSIASSLMGRALDNTNFNCDGSLLSEVNNPTYGTDGAWSCIGKFSQSLLDATSNPSSLTIKTAVVGFGSAFNSVSSYDKSLSQDQNLQNVNNANLSGNSLANDIKNAARWGIIGEGGWYSGNESQDVVNSVNDFISSLSTEIPSVTTGSPTIPADALNPSVLQNNAYFPQFQPTPEKPTQSWLGNLKKYLVHSSGKLVGKSGASIFDDRGAIKKDVSDYWTSDATSSGGA
ncbi:hypothetical protein MY149_04410 [Acinetobacter indicus]|nr:hypothetical protein [Acinetobacter indicus]